MPISKQVLQKYYPRTEPTIFIETGSHQGNTAEAARQIGFDHIYTIELSDKWFAHCEQRFKSVDNVNVIKGDSSIELKNVLNKIDIPCVIWLDAHWSGGDTALGDIPCPVYRELDVIAQHSVKNHTILIDDMRAFGPKKKECLFDVEELKDLTPEGVVERVLSINPEYQISYEDGHHGKIVFPDDILVATV